MIRRYFIRLKKWLAYGLGRSYQHVRQGPGPAYEPGALKGYFIDMSMKAEWTGAFGPDGVPRVATDTTPSFAFPIMIFQWALAHWDLWLRSGETDSRHLQAFLRGADWALAAMTEDGGWLCWTGLQRPVTSPYSAMAQGEGLSVLVRAGRVSDNDAYRTAARRARAFLLHSGPHALIRRSDGYASLEEYPGEAMRGVLNGWIFALVGLVEMSIATGDPALRAECDRFARDLADNLHRYDTGYWSYYDQAGNIASPFYHRLHVDQLRGLARMLPDNAAAFRKWADTFESYSNRRINRLRSVAVKVVQKLGQKRIGEMM